MTQKRIFIMLTKLISFLIIMSIQMVLALIMEKKMLEQALVCILEKMILEMLVKVIRVNRQIM